jgi:hypothetical protein
MRSTRSGQEDGETRLAPLDRALESTAKRSLEGVTCHRDEHGKAEDVRKQPGRQQDDSADQNEQAVRQLRCRNPPGSQLVTDGDPCPEAVASSQCGSDEPRDEDQSESPADSDPAPDLDEEAELDQRKEDEGGEQFQEHPPI